jgi:ribose transport system substrate-binding protein
MFKKSLALIVMGALSISLLSGCGGSKPAETAAPAETKEAAAPAAEAKPAGGDAGERLTKSLAVDVSGLKSSDNQPLLLETEAKEIPQRPEDPKALPEEDPLHWYDLEYSGWSAEKVNIPQSPADGAMGKKVTLIVHGDHPYVTAYVNGAKKVADAYGMEMNVMSPNFNVDVQNQLVDQAINAKPDMIIEIPTDAKVAVQQFRKINQAGIPLIAANTLPEDEGMKYVIGWAGPDDWGQMRMLAKSFAEKMNYEGGYTITQHSPGGSPYFSRTYGIVTELKKIAPNMKLLDAQAPGFEAEKTMQLTSDWITKFGPELKGIMAADDSAQQIGINEACKNANREDIIRIAAGNSKVGMDAVKAGTVTAITYQSAEADGAVVTKMAADWFNGVEVEPVRYLPKHIITKDDVDQYMPAQW